MRGLGWMRRGGLHEADLSVEGGARGRSDGTVRQVRARGGRWLPFARRHQLRVRRTPHLSTCISVLSTNEIEHGRPTG